MRLAAIPLAGAAILAVCALASLPWRQGLFRWSSTPFDRSLASSVAPGYALLSAAAGVIPPGSSVVARTEPSDPIQETYFFRFAVALLPGRTVLPTAFYGAPIAPKTWRDANYVVLIGRRPTAPPGRLLLETPDGTVWYRGKP